MGIFLIFCIKEPEKLFTILLFCLSTIFYLNSNYKISLIPRMYNIDIFCRMPCIS